jgi:hypothetical protein
MGCVGGVVDRCEVCLDFSGTLLVERARHLVHACVTRLMRPFATILCRTQGEDVALQAE